MLRLDIKVIDMFFLYENAAVGYNCCIYIFYAESLSRKALFLNS